jgi:hypothetical protein
LQFCDNSTRAQSKKINFFSKIDIKNLFFEIFEVNIFEKNITSHSDTMGVIDGEFTNFSSIGTTNTVIKGIKLHSQNINLLPYQTY